MPPAVFPPTPAASGDIKGREQAGLPAIDAHFELPPSAVVGSNHTHSDRMRPNAQPQTPLSPAESRKTSEARQDNIDLPPPPTRSRKIIHMKPKADAKDSEQEDVTYTPAAGRTSKAAAKEAGSRKKAGSASNGSSGTAAGRKVARKTAHSIIERRRRSKMNEEFGVLKDMIPACRGVEMHKLAILQASIEYLRYLEDCVSDLKAGRAQSSEAPSLPSRESLEDDDEMDHDDDEDPEERSQPDSMLIDDPPASTRPTTSTRDHPSSSSLAATARAALSPISPYIIVEPSPSGHAHRGSVSSSSTALPSPYFGPVSSRESGNSDFSRKTSASLHSQTTSPIFGPYYGLGRDGVHSSGVTQRRGHDSTQSTPYLPPMAEPPVKYTNASTPTMSAFPVYTASWSRNASAQTSPVIVPQHQGLNEAEASTALLMLNKDRRYSGLSQNTKETDWGRESTSASSGSSAERDGLKRGMSVRDLLRTQE